MYIYIKIVQKIKIPINLTSEGLKCPTKMRIEHKTKHVVVWDTCTSYFGPKKFDRVGRGGQRTSKYGPEWAWLLYIFGLGAF